ncbi:MAG: RNA polymerase sigma factor [Ferruginibacter sp.]
MMTEDELVAGLKDGNPSAFSELVGLYREKIIRTCYRFLFSAEAAEDISQEVFIEVFRSVKSFRHESGLSTWIYRIAVSKCLDEIKRRKRRRRISSFARILGIDNFAAGLRESRTADQPLLEKENQLMLLEALQQLPDNQRIALTLGGIEGYDNKTIAHIMNIPVTHVEMLRHRGKKKLSMLLEKILKKSGS